MKKTNALFEKCIEKFAGTGTREDHAEIKDASSFIHLYAKNLRKQVYARMMIVRNITSKNVNLGSNTENVTNVRIVTKVGITKFVKTGCLEINVRVLAITFILLLA